MIENNIIERQKITINGNTYFLDSLDEDSQKVLNEIRIIDGEMQRLNMQMNIAGLAKNSLLEKLDDNSDKFELAPIEEKEERKEPDYATQ